MKRKDETGSGRESPTGEAVLERAERFGNLLTLSYEPMLAWRLDGPIEFWNAGAERLYGFVQEEAVGRTSHTLLRTEFPIDLADLRSQLRDRRNWMGELRHTCKDGSKVVVESHMQLFHDSLERFGILALGHKESIRFTGIEHAYEELDALERIYRKVR